MAAPQFLHGNSRLVEVPFDTSDATVTFAPGDILIQTSGNAVPIGSGTVTTSFLGVSNQRKAAGVTHIFGNSTAGVIVVATDGEWEYDCTDTIALVVGELMGPASTTSVKKVGDETISIGRLVKAKAANSTAGRVRVKINSARVPAAKTT